MTINKGVEFLIDRMRAHPDEFRCYIDSAGDLDISGRWEDIYEKYKNTLTDADKKALIAVVSEINADKFLGELMAELADGPERRAREKAEKIAAQKQLIKSAQKASTLQGVMQQTGLAGVYDQQKLAEAYSMAAQEANQLSSPLSNQPGWFSPHIKDRY